MMNVALFGGFGLYIGLKLLPLRGLTVLVLWLLTLKESEFFCTLGVSIVKRSKKVSISTYKNSLQEKREKALAFARSAVKKAFEIYEWPIKPVLNSVLALFGHLKYVAMYLYAKYRSR